jgi:hypothetical protein
MIPTQRSPRLSARHSVAYYLGARTPQSHTVLLCFLTQPLELATVGVGEGRCAGQAQLYEILVEEVRVDSILVGIEVDVGECATVSVLRVSYARYLKSHEFVGQHLLRVAGGLLAKAAYGLAGSHGLWGVHADESYWGASSLRLYGYRVAVGHLRHPAVDMVGAAEAVDQAVEPDTRDRIEEHGENEGEGYKRSLGVASRYYAVLVSTGEDGDET